MENDKFMNTQYLTERLSALADFVEADKVMADIGTDHAYLPVYLVKTGKCPKAIACDINEKPLEAAKKNVTGNNLSDKIELRLGNGLQVLMSGEVQVVVIAGMGGNTIKQILADAPKVLVTLETLVLQPMGDEEHLRYWLITNGWRIIDENLVLEDNRLYTIIVCQKGMEQVYDSVTLEIGPRLIDKRHPLLPELIKKLRFKYKRMLEGLSKSNRDETQHKLEIVKERLRCIEEMAKSCQ